MTQTNQAKKKPGPARNLRLNVRVYADTNPAAYTALKAHRPHERSYFAREWMELGAKLMQRIEAGLDQTANTALESASGQVPSEQPTATKEMMTNLMGDFLS
jgi:hypothetical protein